MMDSMGGMLTKGLGGSACTHLIFGPLHLHCGDIPHETVLSGGGRRALKPSTQPLRQRYDEETPKFKQKKQITVTFSLNNNIHETVFIVDASNADKIVKVAKWLNKTKQSLQIWVDNFTKKDK